MSLKVEVKHNGKVLQVEVPHDSTLHELKTAIAKVTNVPPSMQKLMGKASLKNDQEKVSSQGLSNGTKLMMIGSPVKDVVATNTSWNEPTKTERKQKASCALPIDNYLPMLASMLKSEGERELAAWDALGHQNSYSSRTQPKHRKSPDTDEDDDAPAVLDTHFEEYLLHKKLMRSEEESENDNINNNNNTTALSSMTQSETQQSNLMKEESIPQANATGRPNRPPNISVQSPHGSPTTKNISQNVNNNNKEDNDNTTDSEIHDSSPYCLDLTGTAAVNNSKDTNSYYAMLMMEGVLSRINQYEASLQDTVLDGAGEDMDHPLLRFSDLKNREMDNDNEQKNEIFIDCLAKSVNAGGSIRSSIAAGLPTAGKLNPSKPGDKEALKDRSRLAKVHKTLRKSLDFAQEGANAETHTEILGMATKIVSTIKNLAIGEWFIVPCGWVGQQSSSNLYLLVGKKAAADSSQNSKGGTLTNDDSNQAKRTKIMSPNSSTSSTPPPRPGSATPPSFYTVAIATSDAHIANELRWLGTHNNHEIRLKEADSANSEEKKPMTKFATAVRNMENRTQNKSNPMALQPDNLASKQHLGESQSDTGSPCFSNMQSIGSIPNEYRDQTNNAHQSLGDTPTNIVSENKENKRASLNKGIPESQLQVPIANDHRYVVRIPFVREDRVLDDTFWSLLLPLWMIANNPQAKLPGYCVGEVLLDVLLPWLADAIPDTKDDVTSTSINKISDDNKKHFSLYEEQRLYCPRAALHLPFLLPRDLVGLFGAVGPHMEHRPAHKGSFLTQWLILKDLECEEELMGNWSIDDSTKRHRAENRMPRTAAERHQMEFLRNEREEARQRKEALKEKILTNKRNKNNNPNASPTSPLAGPTSPASLVGSPHAADFGSDADDYCSAGSPSANRHKKSYFASAKTNNYFSKNFSNNPHHGGATKALLEALHYLLEEFGMSSEEIIKQVKFVLKYEHFVKAAEDLQLAARKHMPSMFDQLSSPIPPALLSPPYTSPVETPLPKSQQGVVSVKPVENNASAFMRSATMSPGEPSQSSLVPPALKEPPNTPADASDAARNRPQQLSQEQLSSLQPMRLTKLAHGIDQLKDIGIDPTTHLPTLSDLLAAMGPRDKLKTANGVLLTPENFTHSCRVVVVYFTASWSEPCKRIAPMVIDAYNKLKARVQNSENKLEFLLISCDRTRDSHEQYVEQFPFPRMTWPDESILKPFDLKEIPQLLVFAPNGQLMTLDGVDALLEDPEALRFPHAPWNGAKPLSRSDLEILEFASTVLNHSALERFNERLLSKEQLASIQNVIEAVKEVAQAMPHRRD